MIVKNLSFAYGGKKILKDINFNVNSGEIVMVLGVNGAGKSTLMKCLAGIFKPLTGSVSLEAIPRKSIGYLTQNIIENDSLSVFEFVLLGRIGELRFKVSDDDLTRVEHVLEHVGITHFAKRNFNELSGGQQRLVLVAQLLARSPKIMFLDEPTANLDLLHQKSVLELICKYARYYNTSTIINIHNINHALTYADKILILQDGGVKFFDKSSGVTIEILEDVFGVSFEIFTNKNGDKIVVDY